MMSQEIAAYIFSFLSAIIVSFQLALFLGAPLGEYVMGGKFPGRFSLWLRISALLQAIILIISALIVLSSADLIFYELHELSLSAIWFVCALCVVTTILNTITPSKKERKLWMPVTIALTLCVFIVAYGGAKTEY